MVGIGNHNHLQKNCQPSSIASCKIETILNYKGGNHMMIQTIKHESQPYGLLIRCFGTHVKFYLAKWPWPSGELNPPWQPLWVVTMSPIHMGYLASCFIALPHVCGLLVHPREIEHGKFQPRIMTSYFHLLFAFYLLE
jgi:hypothetical protein